MTQFIDESFWHDALGEPDWYLILEDDFKRLEKLAQKHQNQPDHKKIKHEAYEMVDSAVQEGRLPIAKSGENFDKERKPVDTIVIHHTKNPYGMTLERLNTVHLIRIYGKYFANPLDPKEKHIKGQPVWSGHFYQGRQVFWGYHWLIREDGTAKQILDDKYVGWHAGNWGINTRSIGICIDDDLTSKEPAQKAINKIANLIKQHYPDVKLDSIVGHCDINPNTECPGGLFHKSWQQRLLDRLR